MDLLHTHPAQKAVNKLASWPLHTDRGQQAMFEHRCSIESRQALRRDATASQDDHFLVHVREVVDAASFFQGVTARVRVQLVAFFQIQNTSTASSLNGKREASRHVFDSC
jgi:hypothetical protein